MKKTRSNILRSFITVLALLITFSVHAQEQQIIWHWMQQLGGPGWDMSNGIVCDGENHIYIGGGFTGKLVGDKKSVESKGNRDVFIARLAEGGKLEWLWRAGGPLMDKITALEVAPENDLYVAGIMEGVSEFGKIGLPGEGKKLFVARVNKKGKCEWVQPINFSKSAAGYLLKTDAQGNVYLGGVFSDTLKCGSQEVYSKGFSDVFVARFSPAGKFEMLKCFGGKGKDQLSALALDNSGSLYLTGNFDREMQIDDHLVRPAVEGITSNIFLTKWNRAFQVNRINIWHSPSYGEVTGIVINKYSHLFLTGNFSHQLQFDTLTVTSKGITDFFVLQADTTCKISWMKTFGTKYGTCATGLLVNKLNGVMMTGTFSDTLQLDSIQIIPKGSGNHAFSAQFTDAGEITWAEAIGSSKASSISQGATIDQNGSMYVTGTFTGIIQTPSGEVKSMGDEDVFVARYYNCPGIKNVIEGERYICPDSNVLLSVPERFTDVVWNDTLFGSHEITIHRAGSYQVQMVDKNGCVVKDSVTIKEAPLLTFSLGKDTALTTNNTLLLRGPEHMAQYQWQDQTSGQENLAHSVNGLTGIYEYKLTITDTVGCNWDSHIKIEFYKEPDYLDLSAGASLIDIHPNPVSDVLYWSVKTTEEARLTIELTDLNGKVFKHEEITRYVPGTTLQMDMTALPSGPYFFTIVGKDKKVTTKVLKP